MNDITDAHKEKIINEFLDWVLKKEVKVYEHNRRDIVRIFLKMPLNKKRTAKGYIGISDAAVAQNLKRNGYR